jgi:FG-GAP-like repeat
MNHFRSPRSFALLALGALGTLFTPCFVRAQAGVNLVANGDFSSFTTEDNLWDGVDGAGFLAGTRRGAYAETEAGKPGNLDMPLSVNFVDVNGDGLPDLLTADPAGVVRAYINIGTKTEPKFDHAEVVPIFPPQIAKDTAWDRGLWSSPHGVPKISMFDWNHHGAPDMIVGNYCGDILMLHNTGGAKSPIFPQPTNYQKVKVPIAKSRPWGNLFAPCAFDWNQDGHPDLLVGEGSYSANAVYVLLNQSSGSEPKFTEDQRFYLCYGDGREQLVPTVADYNGDGLPDVLVGDRKGTVGVYLNPGGWKPGVELPLASYIQFGNTDTLGMGVAPCAVDYNGDGLFDLLIGKANGRIALAINKGTRTEPKFDAPIELKGEKVFKEPLRIPSNWTLDAGNNRGNLYGYISVAEEQSPGGGRILKAGFFPSPNKVFKMVPLSVDGHDSTDFFAYWRDEWVPIVAPWAGLTRAADAYCIRQQLGPLKTGTTYQLTFKTRGKGIQDGVCTVALLGAKENVATKFKRGDRGAKPVKDETNEQLSESAPFTSGEKWASAEKTFRVAFKDRALKDLDSTTLAILEFKFNLPQYTGECQICDVQLVEKAAK